MMKQSDLDQLTVLIVDDDRINRATLADMLKDECRILLAKDGASALEIIAREDVALILLDVSMPGIDGYEVLRTVKSAPETEDITVIFITGMSEETDEERGLLLGAADYVQKPIRPAIVHARIRVHLNLIRQRRVLAGLSEQDGLTGIANRRYFDKALEIALGRSGQVKPLGLAFLDVDHFKQYNDHYGHAAGDDALRTVASIVCSFATGTGAVAARYGGEEFVLMVPGTTDFASLLDDLRSAISAHAIPHARSQTAAVLTLSGGAVEMPPGRAVTSRALLSRADQLLYEAKQSGRNRILIETL